MTKEQAVGNCYMLAIREKRRLERDMPNDAKRIMAWTHIIRFCEESGEQAQILREQLPTDIQGG